MESSRDPAEFGFPIVSSEETNAPRECPLWTFGSDDELLDHFRFLVQTYALADDTTMTTDAKELANKLREIIALDRTRK